jgi:ubiquinone/menaquinone biosynthesis C-methylase UbiE
MVLHHLHDPEAYIKEFNRVLIKDGILLIREHDIQGDTDRDGKLFLDMLHGFYEVVWAKTGEQENPDFVKTYFANYKDRKNWTTMIERNGFRRLNHAELELYYNYADLVREYGAGRKIKNPFYHYYAVYVKE